MGNNRFWLVVIGVFVLLVVAIVVIWINWDNIAVSPMSCDTLPVEEHYVIEPSDTFRVFQVITDKDTILTGIEDVSHHQEKPSNDLIEHLLYLKKNTSYAIVISSKTSRGTIWSSNATSE
jgi:hypothetical protein